MARREHRAFRAFFFGSGVHEFELHFGGRERHAVEFEVARFLHGAVGHRHVRDDRLADVRLPDAHDRNAVVRHAVRIDEAAADCKRPHGRRQIAAIAAPVDERLVDRHLSEEIVDIMIRPAALRDDHRLAGARRRAAHAVDLLAIRIGAADHAHQQCVARRAGRLRGFGQVLQAKEHAFAGAAAHVRCGNPDLGCVCHVL